MRAAAQRADGRRQRLPRLAPEPLWERRERAVDPRCRSNGEGANNDAVLNLPVGLRLMQTKDKSAATLWPLACVRGAPKPRAKVPRSRLRRDSRALWTAAGRPSQRSVFAEAGCSVNPIGWRQYRGADDVRKELFCGPSANIRAQAPVPRPLWRGCTSAPASRNRRR